MTTTTTTKVADMTREQLERAIARIPYKRRHGPRFIALRDALHAKVREAVDAKRAAYDHHVHTHVTVDYPGGRDADGWQGTFPIILQVGDRVWIAGSYSHEGHEEVLRVGDGTNNGYDQDGNCVLSIPAAWCRYYDEHEAECIERAADADARLLAYAR